MDVNVSMVGLDLNHVSKKFEADIQHMEQFAHDWNLHCQRK